MFFKVNSRCCSNEMPPTTGWTLDFLPTTQKISRAVHKKALSEMRAFITSVCCMKPAHFLHVYNKHMSCEHDYVKFRGHNARDSFLENNFAEFLDEVCRVKINQDFVQSLVAFRYSNICYSHIDCKNLMSRINIIVVPSTEGQIH